MVRPRLQKLQRDQAKVKKGDVNSSARGSGLCFRLPVMLLDRLTYPTALGVSMLHGAVRSYVMLRCIATLCAAPLNSYTVLGLVSGHSTEAVLEGKVPLVFRGDFE
jgi:hypothetical protein